MAALLHKIKDGKFRTLQPAGQNIGGGHAQRAVHDKYHVLAHKGMFGFRVTPLRAGQSEARTEQGTHQKNFLEPPPSGTVRGRKDRHEMWRRHPGELSASCLRGMAMEPRQ